ncbi:MAG: YfiR/HmsC family protein [Flavobacteriales bacterium]|nr:YfiR/HmsC family protein [Flavobacteriales bacterium]
MTFALYSVNPKFSLRIFLFLGLFVFNSAHSFSQNEEDLLQKRVDFILEIANNLEQSKSANEDYVIGIFGKGKESRQLASELKDQTEGLQIQGKEVSVERFKKIESIEGADLLYVNGESELSISSFEDQLGDDPCVIISENFPYGASNINFTMDDKGELFYEIQSSALNQKGASIGGDFKSSPRHIQSKKQWEEKLEAALQTIQEQEETIDTKNQQIDIQEDAIEDQKEEIAVQSDTIKDKDSIIQLQRFLIIIGVVSFVIISGLVFFLFKSNKARQKALLQVEEKNKEIISSIKYAKRIQQAVLPTDQTIKQFLPNSFILYSPKDIIGGDFYWMQEQNGRIYFAVADCTGHGVPGAILSVMFSNWLTKIVKELHITDPGKILDKAVEILEQRLTTENVLDGMDVTLCSIDKNEKTLRFAGAHNSLYFFRKGEFQELKANKQPVARYESRVPFTTHTMQLEDGDTFYLFSDGYHDQFGGEKGKKFTKKRFRDLLANVHQNDIASQRQLLEKELQNWQGKMEQIDDICVMGLKVNL